MRLKTAELGKTSCEKREGERGRETERERNGGGSLLLWKDISTWKPTSSPTDTSLSGEVLPGNDNAVSTGI
jgi:hypothetical protein